MEHVVDVGGGTGETLRRLLAADSHLHGTLFDLLQSLPRWSGGSALTSSPATFFAEPLPRADAYVLSQILHGWPDHSAAEILRRRAEAGGDHSRF